MFLICLCVFFLLLNRGEYIYLGNIFEFDCDYGLFFCYVYCFFGFNLLWFDCLFVYYEVLVYFWESCYSFFVVLVVEFSDGIFVWFV